MHLQSVSASASLLPMYLCVGCVQLASNRLQQLTEALDVLLQLSELAPLLLVKELLDAAVHGGLMEEAKLEQLTLGGRDGEGRHTHVHVHKDYT